MNDISRRHSQLKKTNIYFCSFKTLQSLCFTHKKYCDYIRGFILFFIRRLFEFIRRYTLCSGKAAASVSPQSAHFPAFSSVGYALLRWEQSVAGVLTRDGNGSAAHRPGSHPLKEGKSVKSSAPGGSFYTSVCSWCSESAATQPAVLPSSLSFPPSLPPQYNTIECLTEGRL